MEANRISAGGDVTFKIPVDLLQQFEKEVRIVVRHPWIIGIPVPLTLLKNPEIFQGARELEVMLVPRQY